MADKKNIYQTILNIRGKVSSVLKKGTNEYHKYNYATINDVLHEVRDYCNEEGLLIYPSGISDLLPSKEGQVESFTMSYTLATEDGSKIDVTVRCSGEDKGDKKAYKANTGALKYLFIQLFLMPTEDDPENDKTGKSDDKPWLNQNTDEWSKAEKYIADGGDIETIKKKYRISKENESRLVSS